MEENQNAKRRERIKTILIIFLALLLVLTLFSGTIQNYSLPTVSAQYASYGTINEKIRGSGVVNANQNYDVVAEGKRKVASVKVKVGDEVREGDVLFVLEAADTDGSVKEAEAALQEAELAYQKALLTAAPDYAAENQEIANAREDLQTAVQKRDAAKNQSSAVSDADYEAAKATAASAAEQTAVLNGYLATVSAGETEGVPAQYITGMLSAKERADAAAAQAAAAQANAESLAAQIPVSSLEQEANVRSLERAAETADTAYVRAKHDYEGSGGDAELRRAMEDAEQASRYAAEDVQAAKNVLDDIRNKEAQLSKARADAADAQERQSSAQAELSAASADAGSLIMEEIGSLTAAANAAQAVIDAHDSQGEAVDPALLEEDVTAKERALQTLIIALAEKQRDDKLTEQLGQIDLQKQQQDITKQREALEKLRKDSGTLEVTTKNGGIVNAVNFAAGDELMGGETLASVTLTNSGYTLTYSATAAQARKVKSGMIADVTNAYYSDITAKLVGIRPDTDNPSSTDKILTFDISGRDVTAGQMLSLSLSCTSASYDCVVPNSAIMEDRDGKFVLIIKAKSTPLGNRYFASRVDVKVLASDELSSAVEGDMNASDYVITASEKPINPGDQVRMEESK
ncbi:MAG: biotin/lipoyl-binding protein [Oscillospiraceae bacterium]|nr:biotin/lipoyl-binding protein [Oscillospiraceae bacterium]